MARVFNIFTFLLCGGATFFGMPAAQGEDPWPMWQRTSTRLGNTIAVGPRTPTIAWSTRIDPTSSSITLGAAPVMDSAKRIFVGHSRGLAAVDGRTGNLLWQFPLTDSVNRAPALYGDRVLFGSPTDFFYCVDGVTGQQIWAKVALPHPNFSPVVDANGIIYYSSQTSSGGPLYARRVSDGSLVWQKNINGSVASPALDELGQVFTGNPDVFDWSAYRTIDGSWAWSFIMQGWSGGTSVVFTEGVGNGRVYIGSFGGYLYCLDRVSGQPIWSFRTYQTASSQIALGHNGVIYFATTVENANLFAISPEGQEIWRYAVNEQVVSSPIVDGAGTIYFCSLLSPASGHIHAVRSDGTPLWVKTMPHQMGASPMLAPDGTLYAVCTNKNLYAFRDLRGDCNCDMALDFFDIDPFILAVSDPGAYAQQYPDCNAQLADVNEDGVIDFFDIDPFVERLIG